MKRQRHTLISSLLAVGLFLVTPALLAQQDHETHGQGQGQDQGRKMRQDGAGGMNREGGSGGMMNRERGQEGGMGGGMMVQRMEQMHTNLHSGDSHSGQSAFDLISDVVDQLEANPDTDWERVNIAALRQHLVDMNQVTVYAEVNATDVDGGASYVVTGSGMTRAAIKRMVPMHAAQLQDEIGWKADTAINRAGVTLVVTSEDPTQVAKIRGLGFLGFMVQGEHHEGHHLVMAGGQLADHGAMDHGSMNHGAGQGAKRDGHQ